MLYSLLLREAAINHANSVTRSGHLSPISTLKAADDLSRPKPPAAEYPDESSNTMRRQAQTS